MLLIGDIHITTRHTHAIIDTIKHYIDSFPTEKNLIFMGDYMYMFSYDRKALAELFDLFLQLRKDGKSIYVLAGNHDRIGQQFVYAEWKKIADMLPDDQRNVLRFITSPEIHTIEDQKILFFPFSKHVSIPPSGIDQENTTSTIEWLLASKNNNERLSGEINMLLNQYIAEHKNLTIIHHYYIAKTKFPGQQALFDYKDIALCPDILDNENIRLISWHIHMPFAYKNYLCTGSVRYTSPLEQDHHKFLFYWDTQKDEIVAQQVAINPYLTLPLQAGQHANKQSIELHQKEIDQKIEQNFSGKRKTTLQLEPYILAKTHLTIVSEAISYDELQTHIEPDLLHSLQDVALKRKTNYSTDLSSTLEIAQRNLQESLIDRKSIVKYFIKSRYWEDFDKYRKLLDELQILS